MAQTRQSVCEVCEEPTAEPILHPEEGIDFCGRCAVEMIGAERDVYRKALEDIASFHEHGKHSALTPNYLAHKAALALANEQESRED